jgi:anti-anti-sigma regulatory factor
MSHREVTDDSKIEREIQPGTCGEAETVRVDDDWSVPRRAAILLATRAPRRYREKLWSARFTSSNHEEATGMLELATGWQLQLDFSTDWIFVRIEKVGTESVLPSLSESLWTIAEQHRIHHFIFEVASPIWMTSYLIGQLIFLHKRASLEGGTLRLCGLSEDNHGVLRRMGLGDRFPNYATREDAVMGHLPSKPR